jgi:peroxiredoxin
MDVSFYDGLVSELITVSVGFGGGFPARENRLFHFLPLQLKLKTRCDKHTPMFRKFSLCVLMCASAALFPNDTGAQSVSLKAARTAGSTHLDLNAEPGAEYWVHASSNLGNSNSWKFIGAMTLGTGGAQSLTDTEAGLSYRFYRVSKFDPQVNRQSAGNFRLIDQAGRNRELFYRSSDKAIVLTFLGKDCPTTPAMLKTVQAESTKFAGQNISFWVVTPDSSDIRDWLAAQAAAGNLTIPLIHDSDRLVAREFGITTSTETIAIDPGSWQVFYRGDIAFLDTALMSFSQGQTVTPSRTVVSGCPLELPAPSPRSYSQDIAPLLRNHCVVCHSVGNIGSWAMTNYAIVKTYASSIREQIMTGEMPPWHADPKYGKFANDISLTQEETQTLIDWVAAGAPRGDGPDPLEAIVPNLNPWTLGPPDKILRIPLQSIKATGVEGYRYLTVATTFATDVWLRAAVVRPGNAKVVHHSLVLTDKSAGGIDGFFAGYVPGLDPVFYPTNTAKFLPKGMPLVFQMHYTTDGKPETDQTELGLYLAPGAPKYVLQTKSAFNAFFSIPPGAPDYEVSASFDFAKNSILHELNPHMHLRGSRVKFELVYPDKSRETLLSVPNYEFHWQTLYRFAAPKVVPAGSRLLVTGAFDNSDQNPSNPDPTARVGFGEQTFNEMFIGYFNYVEVP